MKFVSTESIFNYAAIMLLVALSLSKALPNIFLGILFLLFLIKIYSKEAIVFAKLPFVLLGVFFLYLIIKSIFFKSFFVNFQHFTRYFVILLTTLFFIQVSVKKLTIGFLLMSLIALLVAAFNTATYYMNFGEVPFSNGSVINKILVIERPYFGFLCLLSLLLSLYAGTIYKKHKIILYIYAAICLGFILFIAARLSLLSVVLISLVYIFFFSALSVQKKTFLILCGVLILSTSLFYNKNLTNRVFTNINKESLQIYDPRVVIWTCAEEIATEKTFNPIIGGESYVWLNAQFKACYLTKNNDDQERKNWFVFKGFNAHNQFIDFYLIGGIIGLFLFTLFVIYMLYISKTDFFALAITGSLSLFFIFENVFHRQLGCYLIAFVIAFVIRKLKRFK